MKVTGPELEGEARRGHPSSGSASEEAVPDFRTPLPPLTRRETTGDPEL